ARGRQVVDVGPGGGGGGWGSYGKVDWAGGSGAKKGTVWAAGTPARGSAAGQAVPPWRAGQDPPALAVGRQIRNRPAAPGISAMAATRSSGLHGRHLGCFAHPGRSGGNDHGRFRS